MKTVIQVVVALGVVMGVVAAATFLTQYTNKAPQRVADDDPGDAAVVRDPLVFPSRISVWQPDTGDALADEQARTVKAVEPATDHFYDFLFYNPHPKAVDVLVQNKTCTCARVEYALLDPRTWSGSAPPPPTAITAAAAGLAWKPMPDAETPPVSIPAADGDRWQYGLVRVHFKAKKLAGGLEDGPATIGVLLLAKLPGGPVSRPELAVRYASMPALQFTPGSFDLGELAAGQKRTAEVVVWSATRPAIKPLVQLTGPDGDRDNPCFEVGEPVPLSAAEVQQLPSKLVLEGVRAKPLSACRVAVTVHESRNGRQLDLGPFSRGLGIRADDAPDADRLRLPIKGLVRGDVRILDADANDQVKLGTFKINRGATRSVVLTTARTDLGVEKESTTHAGLTAELEPLKTADGSRQWRLTVTMEPDSAAGELPAATAVILRTTGPSPRRLRIPVTGAAVR